MGIYKKKDAEGKMENEKKKYDIPEELAMKMSEYVSLGELVADNITKMSTKKAIKLNKYISDNKSIFWNEVYAMYPELKGKNITFSGRTTWVSIVEDDK